MSSLPIRFKRVVERLGDAITIGGAAKKAVVVLLSRGFAYSLMSPADVDSATRPMRLAYLPHDDNSTAGQTASWDGRTFTVKNVVSVRLRDEVVAKMLPLV